MIVRFHFVYLKMQLCNFIFLSFLLMIADGFTVKGPSGPLVVPLGASVLLPCSVDSLSSMEDLEVDWRRSDSETLVHLFQDGDVRPEAQQQEYHDRAHFFTENIKHGNFSLLLENVRAEDEGEYRCKVYSGQDSGETVVEVKCGFSALHIMVLILCITACGSALLICCLIYCRSNNTGTSRTVQALKVSLVICPNICMFIAFIIWGVTEGFLKETITCCALYVLRPVMLFWAVPYLNDLQESVKPWMRFSTITTVFAVLTVIVYSVVFTYAWKQIVHYTSIFLPIAIGLCFGSVVLFSLCIFFSGGYSQPIPNWTAPSTRFCSKELKTLLFPYLVLAQVLFFLFLFFSSPDFMDLTCVVFVKVLLILVVFEDRGRVRLHNAFVFVFGAVGVILLNSVTLMAELILKRQNGERAVGDLRVIVFPSECAVVVCWLGFSTYAWCCESGRNNRTQRLEMERFSANY